MNKILIISMLSFLFISTFFIGCGEKVKKVTQVKHYELDGAPDWVLAPSVPKSIAITSSSKKHSQLPFNTLRDEAYKTSKKELITTLNKKISATIQSLASKDSPIENIDKAAKKITKNIIDKAKIIKLFQSTSGTVYVLNSIQLSIVSNEMDRYIKASCLNDKNLYRNFLITKSNGSLNIKLLNNQHPTQ